MLIREAKPKDVSAIHQLMIDLAEHEEAAHLVESSEADLTNHLFSQNPHLFADVAEIDGNVVGFAIWFINYSTWRGKHGIYLEDLYVKPEYRGQGVGKQLLARLAHRCIERGYGRLDWWVLNTNEIGLAFYKTLNATPMSDWTVHRIDRDALINLANQFNQSN